MITEIKNGFELKEVKAEPTGGNILYVGGGGPNNYTCLLYTSPSPRD